MLVSEVRSKQNNGRFVVGIQLETLGNLAIEIESSKAVRLRRRAAELVAIKRRQRFDRGGSRPSVSAILPRFFRAGQGAIAHVEGELLLSGLRLAAGEK